MFSLPDVTALSLFLWIVLGIVIQLALWFCISFWKLWTDYRSLQAGHGLDQVGRVPASIDSDAANIPAWGGYRDFKVARKEIEDRSGSICSFYLTPADGDPLPLFKPGQFLTFELASPLLEGAAQQLIRCYSLSDAPRTDSYRVSIKRVSAPVGSNFPAGRSSNFFHDHVQVGDFLKVRAPGGHFFIDSGNQPVVLVAGGIGVTPMLSMLNWCVREQPKREIWLYYGVRNSNELLNRQHLDNLAVNHPNLHLRYCFSDPLPNDQLGLDYQHNGRIDVNQFRQELALKPYQFYICGPTPMMENIVTELDNWGVPPDRVHFEAFGPASIKRPEKLTQRDLSKKEIEVVFSKSGKVFSWQDGMGSLLEFAEANGIRIDSGCRVGSCGTCQTAIRSGEVLYEISPDFDPEPGNCLLCSCIPKTNVTLEA